MDYRIQHKLKTAKEFETQKKYLHAVQIYNSIIEEYPENYLAYLELAYLYEKIDQPNASLKIYESALKIDNEDTEINLAYGQFLIRTKNWDNAIRIFDKLSADEEPIRSYFLGYAYFLLRDYEISKINFLQFIISDELPDLIYESYLYLAKIDYKLNQYESSLKFIKKSEILLSDYWELHLVQAKNYYRLNMLSHSSKSIGLALKIKPKEAMVNYWAGKIYLKNANHNKAEKHLIKFLELKENISPEELELKADKFLKAGKLKESIYCFELKNVIQRHIKSAAEELEKSRMMNNKRIV